MHSRTYAIYICMIRWLGRRGTRARLIEFSELRPFVGACFEMKVNPIKVKVNFSFVGRWYPVNTKNRDAASSKWSTWSAAVDYSLLTDLYIQIYITISTSATPGSRAHMYTINRVCHRYLVLRGWYRSQMEEDARAGDITVYTGGRKGG